MSETGARIRRRFDVHLGNGRTGHKKLREGKPKPEKPEEMEPAGPSRVARLLALAHHFDDMIRQGVVRDQAEIARLMQVTRAWVTRIMNLLYLAPDIQEQILHSRSGFTGIAVSARHAQAIACEVSWAGQRDIWRDLVHSE
jgi:hypothetical protein